MTEFLGLFSLAQCGLAALPDDLMNETTGNARHEEQPRASKLSYIDIHWMPHSLGIALQWL